MKKNVKQLLKTVLLFVLICVLWMGLEQLLYGQVQPSAVDDIISLVLLYFIFKAVRNESPDVKSHPVKAEEPWYTEKWYLEDLEDALVEENVPVTYENLNMLLDACTGIFDDKALRNEMLRDKASEVFR